MNARNVWKGRSAKILSLCLVLTMLLGTLMLFMTMSASATTLTNGAHSETNTATGDVFLGGKYIELGISRHGSFGTSTYPRTAGFHRNSKIGMIVDGDGWDQGNPPTTGDFFLPGTPEERYIFSYYYNGSVYQYNVADRNSSFTGSWKTQPTVRDASSGDTLRAIVTGVTTHNVQIEITYSFGVNDLFYKTAVKITNLGSRDITNVRFVRSFDPDQDQEIGGSFDTYNKVICNPVATAPASDSNFAMVVARGTSTLEGFFFIAFDNRARASQGVSFSPTSAYMTGLWSETHSYPTSATESSIAMNKSNLNGYTRNDTGIAITFNLDTLAVNDEDSFEYFSSLSPNVEDSFEEILKPVEPTVSSVTGATLGHGYTSGGPSVSATVAEGHTISYQWYKNTANSNVGGTPIPGANSASYNVPTGAANGKADEYYYCVVTATRRDNGLSVSVASPVATVVYDIGDHTFELVSTTEPTCSQSGAKHYKCTRCPATSLEIIPQLGHNYAHSVTVPASCTTDGYIEYKCDRDGCGAVRRTPITAPGHSYGDDYVCDVCGHTIGGIEDGHVHDYDVEVFAPTCTAMGYSVYTCACGHSYRADFIDQTGHAWDAGEISVPKTCTTDGVIVYGCTKCDATREAVLPAGHEWAEIELIKPTCSEDGKLVKECTACGAVETEVLPAGHAWDEGIYTVEPTCTEPGKKTCTCEGCGAVEEFEVPALGHTFVNGVCTRCGKGFLEAVNPDPSNLEYGMYFRLEDILSNYGPDLINEYGVLLDFNADADLDKVAVYLTQDGTMWRRCIACVGDGIAYATYVPYLSYDNDIKYTGLNSEWINIFPLAENQDGIWCYSNYATIGVNLEDAYGNLLLSLYHIGQAGAKTRIFDDLDEMIAWLNEGKEPACDHENGYTTVDGLWVCEDCLTPAEGLIHCDDNNIRYCEAGVPKYAGAVKDADGNIYYINSSLTAVKNRDYYVSKTNGLCQANTYRFDAEGILHVIVVEDGVQTDDNGDIRYYVDGEAQYAGLIQDSEGNYYYINSAKTGVKDCYYHITKTNGLLPAGLYYFDENGKMVRFDLKNGLIKDADGELRYYVDGVAQYAGLVADEDGNLYYINSSYAAVKNCYRTVSATMTNGLAEEGTYYFDAEGKMVIAPEKNGLIVDEDGEIRYYVDGKTQYVGLVYVDGYYYYINSSFKAVKGQEYKIGEPMINDLLPAGTYTFDENGRIVF